MMGRQAESGPVGLPRWAGYLGLYTKVGKHLILRDLRW